jgi:hypothetical protein
MGMPGAHLQLHEGLLMPLTREQVIRALGDADDAIVAELIGMGATAEELAEAQAWVANDEPLLNAGRPLPSGRESRLAEMLTTIEEEKSADAVETGPITAR